MVLNSKSDFQQAPLVRIVATTGLMEEQASSQGAGGRRWQELTICGSLYFNILTYLVFEILYPVVT